jgi:hypothetical protein
MKEMNPSLRPHPPIWCTHEYHRICFKSRKSAWPSRKFLPLLQHACYCLIWPKNILSIYIYIYLLKLNVLPVVCQDGSRNSGTLNAGYSTWTRFIEHGLHIVLGSDINFKISPKTFGPHCISLYSFPQYREME